RNRLPLRSKILKSADFCSIKAQNAANTAVLASILTKSEQKSAFLKRGSDYLLHPMVKCNRWIFFGAIRVKGG
ncbi:MAG: hypothetical protein IJ333_02400, partial [Clostridia bacterium]|nr:hypothetical protein [Clostridia bacterium]